MFSTKIKNFIQEYNYPSFNPKGIFFDMDGVLFDSMKYHAEAWVQALNQVGLPFTVYEAYMNEGRTGASTIDGVFMKMYDREASEDEKQTIYHLKSQFFETHGKTERMPFSYDLLNKIKGQNLEIFVVTGSGQPTLIDSLEENFPGIFQKEKMVTAFDVKNGKPNPEPYQKALKKSGLKAWGIVVIENAPLGIESAKAAGLFTIAVNTGPLNRNLLIESGADIVFEDIINLYDQWDLFRDSWE